MAGRGSSRSHLTSRVRLHVQRSRIHGSLTSPQRCDDILPSMRESILRWIGGLAAVPVAVGFIALGVALVTWRVIREVAAPRFSLGSTSGANSKQSAA